MIAYDADTVFDFISDFNNFKHMLPEDRIENWTCTKESCAFRIKGMTDLGLRIERKEKPQKIVMVSDGKVPFPFTMTILINDAAVGQSEAHIHFEGKINPFMEMMVEKPLANFFNMLVSRLTELKLV